MQAFPQQEQTLYNDLRRRIKIGKKISWWVREAMWLISYYDFFKTRGVTPHSEIIVGDEPPSIFWTTLLQKGGHTPFWNHSGRWTTLYLSHPVGFCINIYCNTCRRSLNKVCFCSRADGRCSRTWWSTLLIDYFSKKVSPSRSLIPDRGLGLPS